MPTLTADGIDDLILLTQRNLGSYKWTDIETPLQEYHAMGRLVNKKKVKFESGTGIQFQVMVANSGAAKHVGMFETDNVNVANVMKNANIGWRHTTTNWGYERREVLMNAKPSKIVDLVKTRRVDAMSSLARLMEDTFWSKPSDDTDEKTPFGIAYYVVKNSSTGFNGGAAAGFASGPAGLSPTTYPGWKNYTDQYAAVSASDLIRKMRRAYYFTGFMSPVPQPQYHMGDDLGIYTNYTVLGLMEEALEAQNDSLGNDMASKDGKALFRGVKVMWVPWLENDTTNPVYGLNWGSLYPTVLSGDFMTESAPMQSAKQHNMREVHVDLTWNMCCKDRRKQWVISL